MLLYVSAARMVARMASGKRKARQHYDEHTCTEEGGGKGSFTHWSQEKGRTIVGDFLVQCRRIVVGGGCFVWDLL
jgi:hypothetical protein